MAAVDANTANRFTVGKRVLIELIIIIHSTKGFLSVPILGIHTIDFHSYSQLILRPWGQYNHNNNMPVMSKNVWL